MTNHPGVDVTALPPVDVVRRLAERLVASLPQLDDVVELAAEIAGTAAAAVNLVHGDGQEALAVWGAPVGTCSAEDSMCRVTVTEQGPVHVADARLDERFARSGWVDGTLGTVRFYCAHPLRSREGVVFGTLCVWDERAMEINASVRRRLAAVARHVEELLDAEGHGHGLRRAVDLLDEHHHELQRSNALLTQFAGQVAHDLRTPMTSVRLTLGLLGDLPSLSADPAAGPLLARVEDAGRRMDSLIGGFLALASLEGRTSWAPVHLEDVVREVMEDLEALSGRHRWRIGHLPVVRGDAVQLRALVQNLLANALKYSASSRTREVHVHGGGAAESWWLEVLDTGSGVPVELREAIFQPLVRADTTVEGLGLGLAACRRIATNHHAEIGVHDGPDGGALFRVVATPAPRASVLPQQHQGVGLQH